MSRNIKIIAITFIVLVLSAGIFYGLRDYIFANPPERTVIRFLRAIEGQRFDDSLKYIWPPEREKISTSSNILKSVSSVQGSNTQIKFSKLKYKDLKIDKLSAEINVQGKLNYHFFNASKEEPFNRTFKLIKEGNAWYIKSIL